MATTDAKNFLDAVDTNQGLRTQLKGTFDQILQIAQANGYNVSGDDLRNELRERWGITSAPNYQGDPDTCFFA
jgi:predicted ribosomally synthesized peptide with nif11-like leader